MKKRIIGSAIGICLIIFVLLLFRQNEVTVYIGIAKSDLKGLPIQISIDETIIFNDTLVNNPYKYELKNATLNGGLHSVSMVTSDGYKEDKNVFILFDQHLVIEYYAPCRSNDQCFDVRNRLTKFRVD